MDALELQRMRDMAFYGNVYPEDIAMLRKRLWILLTNF